MANTEPANDEATTNGKQDFDNEALARLQIQQLDTVSLDHDIVRSSFPSDFVFGCASSAYQVEGGAHEGGKGQSTWDTESWTGRIFDGSTGDVACDTYHKYEEDADLMHSIGLDAYRFSVAWSRVFPEGFGEEPNQEGLDYYNRLIDSLLRKGIEPWVTLYHFDLPQALVDKYGGWFDSQIIPAFAAYAEVCFATFGDRVKHWITVNEPTIDLAINSGYRGSLEDSAKINTPERRYIQAHNVLLAHATAVKIYREKYQGSDGMIGLSLDIQWYEPLTDSPEDIVAAETALAFRVGWLLDPLVFGDYPEVIRRTWGDCLPSFTVEEKKLLKGALDFLGVNYYTGYYASAKPLDEFSNAPTFPVAYPSSVYVGDIRDRVAIGEMSGAGLRMFPAGLEKTLLMLKTKYGNPVTYITENGLSEKRKLGLSLEENLQDEGRIKFYRDHLRAVLSAHRNGADVRGFFAWSIMDNFEWTFGYMFKFGLFYVDFEDGQKRYPKASALWFKQLLQKHPIENQQVQNGNHINISDCSGRCCV